MDSSSGSSPTFTGFIDGARLETTSAGSAKLHLAGWLVSPEGPLQSLLVSVDGGPAVRATFSERMDVALRLPSIAHAKHSGFVAALPVKERSDRYTLSLEGVLENGRSLTTTLVAAVTHTSHISESQSADEARRSWDTVLELRYRAFLTAQSSLEFKIEEKPKVSVIVPVLNQPHFLLGCLEAIATARPKCAIEVIVVDDGSELEVANLIARVTGLVQLKNLTPQGFAKSCNQGAAVSRSELLLFLNSDAFVLPGAIEHLAAALDGIPQLGSVGGVLLRSDGSIAEAGGFILPNGTTVPRGRGGSFGGERYRTSLVVDYCSGALLMTRAGLFRDVGGFHEGYSPAYYEDVDLCCSLLARGRPTALIPQASAFHVEHGSAPDPSFAERLISKHRHLFIQRHGWKLPTLNTRPGLKVGDVILFVDDEFPRPERGQGQGRASQIVAGLVALGIKIRFYGVKSSTIPAPGIEAVAPLSGQSEEEFLAAQIRTVGAIFVSRPHHMEVVQQVLRTMRLSNPMEHRPTVIYDAEALQFQRELLKAETLRGIEFKESEIIEIASNEVALATDSDVILTVSDAEASAFRDFGFLRVHVLGYGAEPVLSSSTFAERRGLLTIGPMLEHDTPNADALRWFLSHVAPHFEQLRECRDLYLHVVGENRLHELEALQSRRFALLGTLRTLSGVYDRYRVFIAPVRYAAGIPIKVIEAAAHGIPIVASPLVANQLGWQDERDLLVGYSPEDFAAKCAALHFNRDLWEALQRNAYARIREQFSTSRFKEALQAAVLGNGDATSQSSS